ncbi:MAG TPA: serine/threonine-protein kinase [Myxococcota bacterium]|nr:serine/threonine-protein kinase [Myxococcota bacterium]
MAEKRQEAVSASILTDEMRLILKSLCDRAKAGARPRLGDARSFLKNSLSLDFADYFKFLKRYNYVIINRGDQTLAVTEEGRIIAEQGADDEFVGELKQHFGKELKEGQELIDMDDGEDFNIQKEKNHSTRIAKGKGKREASEPAGQSNGSKYDSKYTRYGAIGSGGIGTVFKGRHNALALDVAIKEIKDLFTYFNFLQRSDVVRHLKEVVGLMATLNHPLVVKIIDENVEIAHPYFVMEYLTGGNLKDEMAKSRLALDRALVMFTQISYALDAAHKQAVIHGNLKPENILIDSQGNARVTDFGMTKLLQTETDRPVPQVITGSIGYLSPEQMKERSVLTKGADIYSLGILFYEMLTGNLPGRRSPLPSEINKDVPKEIDDLFEKMTADSPEERHPDFDAVLSDFYDHFKDGRFMEKGKMVLFCEADKAPES